MSGHLQEGLPLPWLAVSVAIAYLLLIFGLLVWRHALPFHAVLLESAAVQFAIVLVFLARDVLFIQWCTLTRLRQPVVKGVLYLCLYYVATVVLATFFYRFSDQTGDRVVALLTPGEAFRTGLEGLHFSATAYVGVGLQAGLIAVLLALVTKKMRSAPALSEQ